MILQAAHLEKRYNDEVIFQQLNFSLQTGTSAAIVGSSGIGKSTFMSILGLLLQPSTGELSLNGKNLLSLTDAQAAQCRQEHFGFLFQYPQLIGSLTLLDNVLVPACISGKKNMQKRAEMLLEQMGLEHRRYHYPHQLSQGQKRRAALARAMLLEPDFLFADEPTNDLDDDNTELVSNFIFQAVNKTTGLLIITHDMQLAKRADCVFTMENKTLVQSRLDNLME